MKRLKLALRLFYLMLILLGLGLLVWMAPRPRPKDYSEVNRAIHLLLKDQQVASADRDKVCQFLHAIFTGERGEALGLDGSWMVEKIRSRQPLTNDDKRQLLKMVEMSSVLDDHL